MSVDIFIDYQMSIFLYVCLSLKELVKHYNQSIESNSTEEVFLMPLLIAFTGKRAEQKKKKEQKKTKMKRKKECEKRMTVILLEAYKQRPCAHTHTQVSDRKHRNSGFDFYVYVQTVNK
jgi:hypothetical protein